ncbi:MAG: rod shape-determining protein MreD [Actinomycetota bacterium]|nr:rod shape-determining protein MreD [Actinomycetota bacterium]HZY66420.1 rod shape-determining protein MreD [Rubrobacteraceae bacterium]
MEQASIIRAAVTVAVAALVGAVVTPYLDFEWFTPNFTIIAIVFAASGLRDLQGILLGFFGGVLSDTLGNGIFLFGVGAVGGLVAAMLAVRYGMAWSRGAERLLLTQLVAVSVAVYDIVRLSALGLAGLDRPPLLDYALTGILPDALLNALLAYLVGGWLLGTIRKNDNP